MRQFRNEHPASHVQGAGAGEHLSVAQQLRFPIQQNSHARPVGNWYQRRHRRFGVGPVEQTCDIAAWPRRPPDVTEPADPCRAPADRACRTYSEEPVGEREAGLDRTLAQDAVTFVVEHPVRVLRWFQLLIHVWVPPFRGGRTRRPRRGRRYRPASARKDGLERANASELWLPTFCGRPSRRRPLTPPRIINL